jgi:hypothetical protein
MIDQPDVTSGHFKPTLKIFAEKAFEHVAKLQCAHYEEQERRSFSTSFSFSRLPNHFPVTFTGGIFQVPFRNSSFGQ